MALNHKNTHGAKNLHRRYQPPKSGSWGRQRRPVVTVRGRRALLCDVAGDLALVEYEDGALAKVRVDDVER